MNRQTNRQMDKWRNDRQAFDYQNDCQKMYYSESSFSCFFQVQLMPCLLKLMPFPEFIPHFSRSLFTSSWAHQGTYQWVRKKYFEFFFEFLNFLFFESLPNSFAYFNGHYFNNAKKVVYFSKCFIPLQAKRVRICLALKQELRDHS